MGDFLLPHFGGRLSARCDNATDNANNRCFGNKQIWHLSA